jgi:CubicO group peptidase (beta-lactamase class C family)
MKIKHLIIIFLLSFLLTACFGERVQIIQDSPIAVLDSHAWPTKDWQRSSPAEQQLNQDLFDEMQVYIDNNEINLHSLLVVRRGYLVFEGYYDGYSSDTLHKQYSCTKSVVSTLVGIAIDQGFIAEVDQPLWKLLPDRQISSVDQRKPAITLENLLTMSSGLSWQEGDPTFNEMYRSRDWVQYMLEKPIADDPGSRFLYCSGCSHLLSAAVVESTGQDLIKFADQNLFAPLGITDYQWDTDPNGIPIGGWGLELKPQDMAKIGYLYLKQGQWDGQQIVSSEWIDRASKAQIETGGNLGYGYQWWTYPSYGAYTAMGRYGQTIFVIPASEMVIVTTAQVDNHDSIFDLIDRFIVPAIQDR